MNVILFTVIITVLLAVGGTVYNWIEDPHRDFVFLKYFWTGFVASILTLFLEIGRRLFLGYKLTPQIKNPLIDLLGASLILGINHSEEVDQKLRDVMDYYDGYVHSDYRPDEFDSNLRQELTRKVEKYKKLKFTGAESVKAASEARE